MTEKATINAFCRSTFDMPAPMPAPTSLRGNMTELGIDDSRQDEIMDNIN